MGKNGKKPIVIGAICAGAAAIAAGLAFAFKSMKESAKAQHEVDKAEFEATKAEARANFEENKFHNSLARAKADAKQHWDDAHKTPAEKDAEAAAEREARIEAAEARIAEANERYEAAKKGN